MRRKTRPEIVIVEADVLVGEDLRAIAAQAHPEWRATIFEDCASATRLLDADRDAPMLVIVRSDDRAGVERLIAAANRVGSPTILITEDTGLDINEPSGVPAGLDVVLAQEPFTNASVTAAIATALTSRAPAADSG